MADKRLAIVTGGARGTAAPAGAPAAEVPAGSDQATAAEQRLTPDPAER